MNVFNKIRIKLMRTLSIFSFSRNVALFLIRLKKKRSLPIIANPDILYSSKEILKELNENGHSGIVNIGEERLGKIIDYANSIKFSNIIADESFKIDYSLPINPSNGLWYGNDNIVDCKEINELVYDKNNIEIASNYLGATPTVKDVRMWWSFPQKEDKDNHLYGYHYDIDAYKFLKQFIYITDVDLDGGPHVIISKTHKKKSFFEKAHRRLSDKQVEERIKKEDIKVMTAKAGEGFFEDTFCYHKGTAPIRPRLILQIEYAL